MTFQKHANLAISHIVTAPSPATSGTSLVVTTGEGALFPSAFPYNCTIAPYDQNPVTTNAEIVKVTGRTGDTFTIVRAQESTTARSVIVGDKIALTITVLTVSDLEGKFDATNGHKHTGATEDAPAVDHVNLANLQGGTSGQYYHLTSAEYTGTGTGVFVRTSSPTIVTPTIASFVNATHNHQAAAGGNTLAESALALTNVTTNNVTTSAHGFTPIATAPAANVRTALVIDNTETSPTFKVTLDATAPTTIGIGDTAAAGTALVYAHRDHQHASPATWTPSAHNQAWSTITSTPTTLSGYGITDILKAGAGVLTLSSASAYTLTIPATGTAALLGTANVFTANNIWDTNTLFVDATNHRVGIGTTNPDAVLNVIGNSTTMGGIHVTAQNVTDAPWISFGVNGLGSTYDNFGSITNSNGFRFRSMGNVSMIAGDSYAFKVLDPTAVTTYFTVLANNGNVGIGTTNPTQRLDTSTGYVNAARYYTNGNTNTYLKTDGTAGIQVNGGYFYAAGATTSLYVQNTANFRGNIANDSAGYLTIAGGTSSNTYFSGNVGIGTTLTAAGVTYQKLNVTGSQLFCLTSSMQERELATFVPSFATNTDATRKARLVFNVYDTAAREAMRIEASGTESMLGFYGASAVARPAATDDIRTALINLGLYTTGGASPLNLNGGALSAGTGAFSSNVTLTTKITTYNNVATAGYGVPAIVDSVALTAQAADIANTNFANSGTVGTYLVFGYIMSTAIDGAAGVVRLHIGWNNGYTTYDDLSPTCSLASYASAIVPPTIVRLGSGSVYYSVINTGIYGNAQYAVYLTCLRVS